MTTLIAAYNSDGCIGRCDARCHDATTPRCTCICGGLNHGVGHDLALANTKVMTEAYLRSTGYEWEYLKFSQEVVQLELPLDLHSEVDAPS